MNVIITTTLHPFSQMLKIFSRIGAPIVAPPSNNFNMFYSLEIAFLPRKKAASYI